MARAMGRLTALKVDKAKKPGMYADGGGLYLRVTPEGARNWVLRYMLDRRPRWMGLGPLALYGLQDARAKALDARRKRHEGIDPIEARRAERARQRLDAGEGDHVQAMCRGLHCRAPRRMAQRQARGAVGRDAFHLRLPHHWRTARAGGGHRPCAQGAGTDLDGEARNGKSRARAPRKHFGLRQGAGRS
jgi:Arm DNA-binding domain